jgi:Uma2 family endonuclease
MATLLANDSLVEELMATEGKAEIVNGEIVRFMSTGGKPSYAALKIAASLLLHSETLPEGTAFGDNAGFLCDLPNRRSFSPDAAFYIGPELEMGFLPIPPVFAVEVRSENDYGPKAEREMVQKRADYFAAGTLVVWDVDLQSDEVIAKYSANAPFHAQIFRRGEVADAQPAVPGWTMPVEALFVVRAPQS